MIILELRKLVLCYFLQSILWFSWEAHLSRVTFPTQIKSKFCKTFISDCNHYPII